MAATQPTISFPQNIKQSKPALRIAGTVMANSFVAGAYQNIHMLTTKILNNYGGWEKRMAGAFAAMTGIFQMDRAQRQPSVEKSKGYDSFRVFAPLFMKKGKRKENRISLTQVSGR